MINRAQAQNPNGSKVGAFTRNHTKFSSFKVNLTLKIKVKVTNIQNCMRHLDDQLTVKFKSKILKVKFKKITGLPAFLDFLFFL